MKRLLVTSDLHLNDKIWKHRPIEGDSYHSWKQIVELAVEHECVGVILAGDILDKQTNVSRPVKELVEGVQRLDEYAIEVYYNQGQHEYQTIPWMSLSEGTIWLQEQPVNVNEVQIAGCDFQQPDGLSNFLLSHSAQQADVLVCHQVWLEFMGEECKPQGSFADVPENVRWLITGDYHEHICQKYGQLTVLSPGSTHLRSISEPEDKYVFFFDIPDEAGGEIKISSWPLMTRRKIEIDAVKNPDFKDVKQQIEGWLALVDEYNQEHNLPEELRKPLMRLTYRQADVDLSNKVIKFVADRAHLFFKQVKQVSADELEPQLAQHMEASERVGMINCLDTYVDKADKPLTHGLATKLLQAPDPEQALHHWVKERVK